MDLKGKKLGVLLSAAPGEANFGRAIKLATTAIKRGVQVYFYCLDDAVAGLGDQRLREIKESGVNLFACAYGAQKRNLTGGDLATFAGLATVNDLIVNTDRFVSFN